METIVLHVDSKFRNKSTYPNSGKFNFELDNPIKNIQAIRLSSIELPNVFYEFTASKQNNFFYLNEVLITIPDGNYTADQMLSEINTQIGLQLGNDISFSLNRSSGHVIVKSLSETNFYLNFTKDNSTPYNSLGSYLGFRTNEIKDTFKYVSESILQTIGDNYIFLKVNDYGRVGSVLNDKYVMAKIIVNKYKNCMVFDDFSNFITKTHEFYQPINLNRLCIELIDSYGMTIDMNGIDFSITLEVIHIYNSYLKVKAEKYIF
jgi:hypothetical protein